MCSAQTNKAASVVVVGGANMDIAGRPTKTLARRDSNPGHVFFSPGGAGRNIAHNLALLGQEVKLISAFGDDPNAAALMDACTDAHIDISPSLRVDGASTSCYVFIMDERGDMELAVSDMDIFERITKEALASRLDVINAADVCVIDTNLPLETLEFLAQNVTVPLLCDPVSSAKAQKIAGLLGHIHTLKPNRYEAEILSGIAIRDKHSLGQAADKLLATGLERVFISLDEGGLFCATHDERYVVATPPCVLVNATGAGDTMMAALAWQTAQGADLAFCARAGVAAASLNIESSKTINNQLSAEGVYERMKLVEALAEKSAAL